MSRRHLITFIVAAVLCLLLLFWLFSGDSTPVSTAEPMDTTPREAPIERPLSPEQTDMILDLFDPSQGLLDQQKSEAALAAKIEQALTVSFVLRRCDYLSQSEYADTHHAIHAYAQRMKLGPTPEQTRNRLAAITEAANASYTLIYGRTDCNHPSLPPIAEQLEDWREAILDD